MEETAFCRSRRTTSRRRGGGKEGGVPLPAGGPLSPVLVVVGAGGGEVFGAERAEMLGAWRFGGHSANGTGRTRGTGSMRAPGGKLGGGQKNWVKEGGHEVRCFLRKRPHKQRKNLRALGPGMVSQKPEHRESPTICWGVYRKRSSWRMVLKFKGPFSGHFSWSQENIGARTHYRRKLISSFLDGPT